MTATRIPWCDETWPLWDGCSWTSRGCDNCWAKSALARIQRQRAFSAGRPGLGAFEITDHPARLLDPPRWRRPRLVFVCPCGDFFHPKAHDAWRRKAWAVMCAVPRHTYLVLTKRPERIPKWLRDEPWPDHIWLGVSIESDDYWWRLEEGKA
jgi:protein gp37